jgi:hypothetical protein
MTMQARHVLLCISLIIVTHAAANDEEDENLPPLELLGFIADFSDEDEGWTDPEVVEDMFSLDDAEPAENEGSELFRDSVKQDESTRKQDSGLNNETAGQGKETAENEPTAQ